MNIDIRISIITVCKNAEKTIERTIKSVVQQDYDNVEFIIIDGASTDNTVGIINKYKDSINTIISKPDDGIYYAMNEGIELATGDYIAFLNADDWYEKNAITNVIKILNHDEVDLFYGKVKYIRNNIESGYMGVTSQPAREELFFGNIFCHQGLFIKRELFDIVGLYDTRFKIIADYAWLSRANDLNYFPKVYNIDVANYRSDGVSDSVLAEDEFCSFINKKYHRIEFTNKDYRRRKGQIELSYLIRTKNKDFLKTSLLCEKYYIWGLGYWGKKIIDWLKGGNILVEGIILSNTNICSYEGVPIISAKDVNSISDKLNETPVIIATEKYEEEIVEGLRKINIGETHYILMSKLFEHAESYYYDFF